MKGSSIEIVKRGGRRPSERFSRPKLYASVHAACLSLRSPDGAAGKMADNVCDAVIVWLETKPEVTSEDIRRKAADTLDSFHPEAAYLYKHYRVVM